MVIKSDNSPTSYLELNLESKHSRRKMKYDFLPMEEDCVNFIQIRPK